MKKSLLTYISRIAFSLVAVVFIFGCEDKKPGGDAPIFVAGIEISNVVPTFGSVTFTVKATDATAIAYICVKQNVTLSAAQVFEQGISRGESGGTYTVQNLDQKTAYKILVAKKGPKGTEGPSIYSFATLANTGMPDAPDKAGIRIDQLTETNVIWEVVNGADIDISYTSLWPDAVISNLIYEAEKSGATLDDVVIDMILGYPYLCDSTVGKGGKATFDYSVDFPNGDGALMPDAPFMIITMGVKEIDGKKVPAGVQILRFRSPGFDIEGAPNVTIEALRVSYISIMYEFTPNADTRCYAYFATSNDEANEFINHWDKVLGAGQGTIFLRDFVRYSDIFLKENVDVKQESVSYGFGLEGKEVAMMAVGMDEQFMPGQMALKVDRLKVPDPNAEEARYSFTVKPEYIGATNHWYDIKFEENCGNVYWRAADMGTYEAELAKLGPAGLARDLWYQGWGEGRPTGSAQGTIYENQKFAFSLKPNFNYVVYATALNFDGGLSVPKIVSQFRTKAISYGTNDPATVVSTIKVSKTMATLNYKTLPEPVIGGANDARVIYHVVLEDGHELLGASDSEIINYILTEGNEWSVYSNDELDVEHPYDWNWTWGSMTPGTKYHKLWLTEDANGELSALKRLTFTTARNDGGPSPDVAINIVPESIYNVNTRYYHVGATYEPNADVTAYRAVFVDEYALKSWGYKCDTKENLETALVALIGQFGMDNIEALTVENDQMPIKYRAWATSLAQGVAGAQSKLNYIEFNEKGIVGKVNTVKLAPCKESFYFSPALRGIEARIAQSEKARATATVSVRGIKPPFSVGEPQAVTAINEGNTVTVKSMKEMSMEILTKSRKGLKK